MLESEFSKWPLFSPEEGDAVRNVLLSNKVNYWTGSECRNFEEEFAAYCNASFAVALSNGTVALELALKSMDIGVNDEVIVTSRTFIASASSIVNVGATPIFSEVDIDTQNITAEFIRPLISNKTKAIICVHLAGMPCEMKSIMQIAESEGLYVIEDCAQAHGAKYYGKSVGTFGHIGAWSFCQDKIITTGGEGGMITTNDKVLWSKIWSLKDHGKNNEKLSKQSIGQNFKWIHDSIGSNYRMTEMQAVIGRIQLKKLDYWIELRTKNAEKILKACESFPTSLNVFKPKKHIKHAWYKCYVFLKPDGLKSGWNQERIISLINNEGVPCFSGACPEVYLEKAFIDKNYGPENFHPNARKLGVTSLMFLVHPSLTQSEIDKTCQVIISAMGKASR